MPRSLSFASSVLASAVLTLSACAPATRVTLLPEADGKASAVEVATAQGKQLISTPYRVAKIDNDGNVKLAETSATEVQKEYPQLLALQPPAPATFVLEFEPGTSALTADSLARLPEVIQDAQKRAGGEIVVTGHTDRQGSLEANDALSLERARAVRDLLVGQGFNIDLIEAVGRGEREPVVATEDEVAEPRNRRAQIIVR